MTCPNQTGNNAPAGTNLSVCPRLGHKKQPHHPQSSICPWLQALRNLAISTRVCSLLSGLEMYFMLCWENKSSRAAAQHGQAPARGSAWAPFGTDVVWPKVTPRCSTSPPGFCSPGLGNVGLLCLHNSARNGCITTAGGWLWGPPAQQQQEIVEDRGGRSHHNHCL